MYTIFLSKYIYERLDAAETLRVWFKLGIITYIRFNILRYGITALGATIYTYVISYLSIKWSP